jgi:hypothetical protein
MTIVKSEHLTSTTTLKDFADSMKQKRFNEIEDPIKRQQAIYDHLMDLMINTIHDRTKAADLAATRIKTQRDYGGMNPTIEDVPVGDVE